FGAVDLDDATAWDAAHAQRDVEGERAGRHGEDVARGGVLAHAHDTALAELTLDLGDGGFEGFVPIHVARSSRVRLWRETTPGECALPRPSPGGQHTG